MNKKTYDATFSLEFINKKLSRNECLLCETNLNEDIGYNKWHIPLCKKHRMEYLDEITIKTLAEKKGYYCDLCNQIIAKYQMDLDCCEIKVSGGYKLICDACAKEIALQLIRDL
jgi:hypothetical protein